MELRLVLMVRPRLINPSQELMALTTRAVHTIRMTRAIRAVREGNGVVDLIQLGRR